jgi:hypothetical protein
MKLSDFRRFSPLLLRRQPNNSHHRAAERQ